MNTRSLLLAAASFAAGVGLTLVLKSDGGEQRAPARENSRGESRAATLPEVQHLQARLEAEAKANAEIRATVEELERKLRAYGGGADEPVEEAATQGERANGPRWVFTSTEKQLRGIDWKKSGQAYRRLMPVLADVPDIVHGRKEMPPTFWGDIMKWSGEIVTEAIKTENAGVRWSHPSVVINLIHATLADAGQPLTEKQEEELYAIGVRFTDEDARRLAGYGEDALKLQQMFDEVELQNRMYEQVEQILDAEQRAVLYPESVRGILGLDLFAGSILWQEHYEHIEHAGREDLRKAVLKEFTKTTRAELRPHLEAAVDWWIDSLPDAFVLAERLPVQTDDLEIAGRVHFAAARQIAFIERLRTTAPLTHEEKKALIDIDRIYVPILEK